MFDVEVLLYRLR